MWKKQSLLLLIGILGLIGACTKKTEGPKPIDILSISVNGSNLTEGASDIPIDADISIVFSSALDPVSFEAAFSIAPNSGNSTLTYANQSSKVTVDLNLAYQTTYTLTIGTGPIGQNGEQLENGRSISFTSMEDGTIYSMPACTSASNSCLHWASLSGSSAANFEFYASYPIYEEQAEWRDLTAAIIVVHGVSRNANDYFNYVMATLQAENLEDEVLLLSPFFKQSSEANGGDYYWSGSGWREGQNSANSAKISSFEILDQIIAQLADKTHFPALKKVIVTGHSSGALFTHLYAAANQAEEQHSNLTFEYVVANSQYFYYPDGQRVNENTNQVYLPNGCSGYDIWPLGFAVTPPSLSSTTVSIFNDRFVNSSITYLLGNGTGSDGSLNTTDCFATLLGSSRYDRGENMFKYMDLVYPGGHNHSKAIVNGIGHNGSGMYQSPEFIQLLDNLLEN